ncbi:MAG TPA: hypothetical protein VLG69_01050 [Candidatus Andersenbacteria bacterium]|nr:hypothetical protein [Candidatus Andersenbacteria bacterium]
MTLRNVFLFSVVICTILFGTIYAVGQRILRQDANDPQIQLAQDIANLLSGNARPSDLASSTKIDMAKSLAPFLIVTDTKGVVLTATGQLDNQIPTISQGVLDASKKTGQNRVTWEPKKGVRIALVVAPYPNGFVAVGRSLREVELRETMLFRIVAIAWLISVVVLLLGTWKMKNQINNQA